MTEFVISASFFLIPLFLGTYYVAKYIDIKQANIQAARYQAWEYTVWFANDTERGIDYSSGRINNGGEVMSGFNAFELPVKTTTETLNESKQRFYTSPGTELTTPQITSMDGTTGWTVAQRNPFWDDRGNTPLYGGANGINANLTSSTDTPTLPVIGDIINLLLEGIGLIFGVVGDLMSLVGSDVKFNAITTEGYANVSESMSVNLPESYSYMKGGNDNLFDTATGVTQFNMISSAAVLSDAWNTGGKEHTYNQVGGMVPTTLLNELFNAIPGFTTIWSIASVLAPELRLCNPTFPWPSSDKGSLWLGHIDIDAIHPDRLVADPSNMDDRIGAHEVNAAGMSNFTYTDPANARTDADRSCQ
ncbi:MAG: hypothetical protein GKR93_14070 [Gammaproteobacteria bacterium]|nr:hypothetical protein [Gammaproteobacteria bacterium]